MSNVRTSLKKAKFYVDQVRLQGIFALDIGDGMRSLQNCCDHRLVANLPMRWRIRR